jgi:hypothetical protein
MKKLIQYSTITLSIVVLSNFSFSQQTKQVQSSEKNYVDIKKIGNSDLKSPNTQGKNEARSSNDSKSNNTVSKINTVQTVSVGTKRPVQTASDRIKEIDAHLAAIERKEAFIKEDPKETKIAEEENWFEKMEVIKKELREEKAVLETHLDNGK